MHHIKSADKPGNMLQLIDKLSDISGKSVSYLVWIGAVILSVEVVSRYFFQAPTIWAHGYSQRIFGSYFILVGAFTLLRGGHVRVDLIIANFSFRTRKFFDIINYLFLLIWSSVLITEGWEFFSRSWKVKEVDEMALAHPVYPVKFILVTGAVLIFLQGLAMLIRAAISMIKGEEYGS